MRGRSRQAEAEARLAEGDDSARLLLGAPDPPAPWRGGRLGQFSFGRKAGAWVRLAG